MSITLYIVSKVLKFQLSDMLLVLLVIIHCNYISLKYIFKHKFDNFFRNIDKINKIFNNTYHFLLGLLLYILNCIN